MTLGRPLVVGLIVVATAAFVIGVALERNAGDKHDSEASKAVPAESSGGESSHAEEGAGKGEAQTGGGGAEQSHTAAEASGGESDATVLGIDLESTPCTWAWPPSPPPWGVERRRPPPEGPGTMSG